MILKGNSDGIYGKMYTMDIAWIMILAVHDTRCPRMSQLTIRTSQGSKTIA